MQSRTLVGNELAYKNTIAATLRPQDRCIDVIQIIARRDYTRLVALHVNPRAIRSQQSSSLPRTYNIVGKELANLGRGRNVQGGYPNKNRDHFCL